MGDSETFSAFGAVGGDDDGFGFDMDLDVGDFVLIEKFFLDSFCDFVTFDDV